MDWLVFKIWVFSFIVLLFGNEECYEVFESDGCLEQLEELCWAVVYKNNTEDGTTI